MPSIAAVVCGIHAGCFIKLHATIRLTPKAPREWDITASSGGVLSPLSTHWKRNTVYLVDTINELSLCRTAYFSNLHGLKLIKFRRSYALSGSTNRAESAMSKDADHRDHHHGEG